MAGRAAYEHLKELNMFGPASGALARPGRVHVVVTSPERLH